MDDLAPRLASQERVADDFGVGHAHNPQECYYGAPPTAEETLAVGRGLPALQQQQQQHSAWALGGGVLPSLHHTLAPLPAKATSVPSAASLVHDQATRRCDATELDVPFKRAKRAASLSI